MNRCIYIHETVEIVGNKRAEYLDYMCEFAPIARRERKLVLFGVWGAIGSTTRWPTAINLWEAADWQGMASNFEHETASRELHDPSLRAWIGKAQEYRRAGYDRLLIAEPDSPTASEAVSQSEIAGARLFVHETVRLVNGVAREYLERMREQLQPIMRGLEITLAGAYHTAMRDDSEAIVLWAVPDWSTWANYEQEYDQGRLMRQWRESIRPLLREREAFVMCSGPNSPLKVGRLL